ncbi:hypothetical protein KJY40_21215 [Pseudomonas fitomaticsae]|uniref:Uncharacterized protein n=1 Tax=Pseudomonas fitomaticsae TaxID=2837969 RepID=A0ABY3QA63_9PSED|nr:hypothetical protein KJY40_21215 [Pseudomonas fitomaticsae]
MNGQGFPPPLALEKRGNGLVINGEVFDFSPMRDGDVLPLAAVSSYWFMNDIFCSAGEIELTLMLPLPTNYSQEQAFPDPVIVIEDGPIPLPQPLPEGEVLTAPTVEGSQA